MDPTDDGSDETATTVGPGISPDVGLENVSALVSAHRQSLNESGFTYRFDNRRTERVSGPDGSDRETVEIAVTGRVAAESGLSPYLINETDSATDPATTTVQYVGETTGAQRISRGSNATVEAYDDEATALLTTHYLFENFLAGGNWTVSERRDDALVLETDSDWSDWRFETAGERNVSARTRFDGELVVSRDGRIERLTVNETQVERVRENGDLRSRATTVHLFEYELLETDGTQVERPAWAAREHNATTASG